MCGAEKNNCMKKISEEKALEIAYKRLYNSKLNKIDKNLDAFLKAKKFVSRKDRLK